MPYFTQEKYRIEIGKIVCIDRAEDSDRVLFIKPASSIIHFDQAVEIPEGVSRLGFNMMIAMAVGKKITKATKHKMANLMGYGAVIDVYDMDMLEEAKEKGLPWMLAKGSDTFCPISDFTSAKDLEDPYSLEVYLEVNETQIVKATTREMKTDIEGTLEWISNRMSLYPGDMVCIPVSDPEGELVKGDVIEAGISSVGVMRHIVKGSENPPMHP
ncbi:MAG: fumarylacetoacetate hydrolase family protein [Candidatus Thermoplasmatota archaeon]|nr:fumarylacetoacetate hydrolase family protein [Candidatus Thermoplasmatota archaeon]